MIEVLTKPFEQIAPSDIQALIDSKVPEGEQIEYKKELSRKGDGSPNPWMSNEEEIGDKAKNAILKEAVAFANAYGGALLLGIRESKTKPSVAAEIIPIPRCAELAERLKLVFRDRVEPELPRIEIFAVPTECDSGVVMIRVGGQSRLAPHRVTNLRVCPIRRQDRCEEMTMREIQDMTLNVSRGLERLDKRLSERAERFQQEFKRLSNPNEAVGVRATAVPVGDEIRFDRVFRQNQIVEELDEQWWKVLHRGNTSRTLDARAVIRCTHWRPMLRAARAEESGCDSTGSGRGQSSYREIHCDGLVELGFASDRTFPETDEIYLPPDLPAILFANLIAQAHRVKIQAGVPMAEYAVEVEIHVKGVAATAGAPETSPATLGKFDPGPTKFPLYSLGDSDEAHRLLNLFHRDFNNALGRDIDTEESRLEIEDWPSPEENEAAEDPS